MTANRQTQTGAPLAVQPEGPSLTIAQAEQLAIRNNPNISVARLVALAQAQVHARSAFGRDADSHRKLDRRGRT